MFSRFNMLSPLVSVRLNIGILEMLSHVDAMMQGQGTTSCADLLYECVPPPLCTVVPCSPAV